MPQAYLLLAVAIVAEVVGTSALKAAEGFSKLGPSLIVIVGYSVAFFFMSLAMRDLPVGLTYAIWSGAGIVLITMIALVLYRQVPDLGAWIGIGLIVSGIVVLNLFSKFGSH